jgi:hypothetical protein
VDEIALSEAYLKTGGARSAERIVQAGHRLGALLKQIMTDD